MCLIIAPGRDGQRALLPREVFDYAYTRNDDGFGGMYVEDGRVKHFKTLGLKRDEEYEQMEKISEEHEDVIFHMRYKTHGATIPSLCHPFRILHKNRHGKDLFFMHNGILSDFGKTLRYGQSDTTNFKDKVLIPLLTRNPNALDDPEIMAALNKMTSGSRLIFLDSNGKVYKTSESSWNSRYGLSLSNTYMLPDEKKDYFYPNGHSSSSQWQEDWRKEQESYKSNVVPIDSKEKETFSLFRRIVYEGGNTGSGWFKEIKKGFLRSQYGLLFRDRGPGISLNFKEDYIPKQQEFEAILEEEAVVELTPVANNDDELFDDELPARLSKSETTSAAERLRYARIVHNCHTGSVVSRPHLMADILGMDNSELLGFIKEDPETAAAVMAELYEIILEQNDLIEDPEGDFCFDTNILLELGDSENHRKSMQEISQARRDQYEAALRVKEQLEANGTPDNSTETANA